MTPADYSHMDCSIARTLGLIGERWSLLILRDAFYGLRRFEDFQRDLGIARNVLADRLSKLVENGLLERRLYEERPPRYEYRLTLKGRDLLPVLLSLMRWGDRWESNPDEPPVKLIHHTCGNATHPVTACAHCGEELTLRNVSVDPIRVKRPETQPSPTA
ncbi:MAG: helix-turn-helix transcriptional regulator [Actinomycetota bacterium]|nr:helix-turn-helix transcriptional regulator [Actinomycetota bacterium]